MALRQVYIALGSNLGDREQHLDLALRGLESIGVHVLTRSSLYQTAPQDVIDQPWFLNMAAECETGLLPLQLLAQVHKIECELGRIRGKSAVRRGPRTIDIDILLYGTVSIETPGLVIPHPRMLQRRFVLEPLVEIAPELRHPQSKELLSKYLKGVAGQKLSKLTPH